MICNSRFYFTGVNQPSTADVGQGVETCLEALILENLLDCNGRILSRRVQERGLEDDAKGAVSDDFQVVVLDFPRRSSLAVRDVDLDDLPRIVKLWKCMPGKRQNICSKIFPFTTLTIELDAVHGCVGGHCMWEKEGIAGRRSAVVGNARCGALHAVNSVDSRILRKFGRIRQLRAFGVRSGDGRE